MSLVALFFAVVLHEISHGWIALKLGDPTAKKAGRLTLNPKPHIDPVGTILVPLSLVLLHFIFQTGFFIFGWAKPVPIDPRNFKDEEKGMLWVGLSGPLTNLLLFSMASLLGRLILPVYEYVFQMWAQSGSILLELSKNTVEAIVYFLGVFAIINTILAAFNLIPIPPLDGSRVLQYFLPQKAKQFMAQMEQFGFLIILALIWFGGLQGLFSLLTKLWKVVLGAEWLGIIGII